MLCTGRAIEHLTHENCTYNTRHTQLARYWRGLQVVLRILSYAISSGIYLLMLVLLFMFVMGLLGLQVCMCFCRVGYLRPPKWVWFLHDPRAGGPNWFQAQLWYVVQWFQCSWLETYQLGPPASAAAAWTLLFEQQYAVSDQPAHQTRWFLVFLIKNIEMGQKEGWREMQVSVPFPLKSIHLGYRCTTCAFNPVILYAGRLSKSEHMLG